MKGVAILGSTGSIGCSAARVLLRHRDSYRVRALTAFSNHEELLSQEATFEPTYVGIIGKVASMPSHWRSGAGCLTEAATRVDVDIVINALVGAAGLDATLSALRAGKRVALANKESLVMAGELVLEALREGKGELVPIDSEHSAILQCLAGRSASDVKRLILTASGGPFRMLDSASLARVTVDDALRHPTWKMGRKITVDSATLANKALEVIEAHFLFGLPFDRIEVVVHPQSIIHSFVEFMDGSVLAQLGVPSMELPILYALTHPERVADSGVEAFDPVRQGPFTFEPVQHDRFPALQLGIRAGRMGGVAPAIFNAANEQAVALFLDRKINFSDIPVAIESALDACQNGGTVTRESVLHADGCARRHVLELLGNLA